MEYRKLNSILKRYSFEEKMAICQQYSEKIMSPTGIIKVEYLRKNVMPWELETFALFSIMSVNEYNQQTFNEKGIKNFYRILETIRNYIPSFLTDSSTSKFTEKFLIVVGQTQFPLQQDYYYKAYRYNYLFNYVNHNIDMPDEFRKKFGCVYNDFKVLGLLVNIIFSTKTTNLINGELLNYIFRIEYPHVANQLMKSRMDLIESQKKITPDSDYFIYGFKLLYQFPLIQYKEITYLPLPHLFIHATTSSLLYRLTEQNESLRQAIGKEVLEDYLYTILKNSKIYDEVIPEYQYHPTPKNEARTADVMIRKKDKCLLLDSKSFVASIKTRHLDTQAIEFSTNRLVKNIEQLYRHICFKFIKQYYPFKKKLEFNKEDIFGIIVILEDSYISKESLMKKAAHKMEIEYGSYEFNYLCSHIKVLDLYAIEEHCFTGQDIIELLYENSQNESNWFDISLCSGKTNREFTKEIKAFISEQKVEVRRIGNKISDYISKYQ